MPEPTDDPTRRDRPQPRTEPASRRPPRTGGPGCWRRCAARSRGQAVAAVLLASLGFAAVTQVQGQRQRRPVRRRAAGRPDPVHQQPLAGLPARARPRSRARAAPGTRCAPTPTPRRTAVELAQARRPTPSASSPARVPAVGPGRPGHRRPTPARASAPTSCSTGSRSCATPAPRSIEINDQVRVVAQTSIERRPTAG